MTVVMLQGNHTDISDAKKGMVQEHRSDGILLTVHTGVERCQSGGSRYPKYWRNERWKTSPSARRLATDNCCLDALEFEVHGSVL